ncbi:MAG: response regulator transcription factor [Clostridia bacterium]|nr:response regulator transcription factor [Clostridia bacterium]
MKALIVDDEYPARAELRYRLSQFPDVEVVGEAASAREAMQLIEALDYDVLFLDVQMPGLSGVELARRLKERGSGPRIVFVTAYDDYALDAFEARAVDYLLKPFDDARLAETISRLREGTEGRQDQEAQAESVSQPAVLEWIPADREGRTVPVATDDVVFIEADGDNVVIHTATEAFRARFTLQGLHERLPAQRFFRCHRSYIANIYQVREIVPYFNGTYLLVMKDRGHTRIPVSRANARRLKAVFGLTWGAQAK